MAMHLSEFSPFTKEKTKVIALALGFSVACLCPAGCSGPPKKYDATASGTVTVDGELAPGGTVTFHPTEGGPASIGHINPGGSYSLRTGQGNLKETDGGTIKSGDYIVTTFVNLKLTEEARNHPGGPPTPGANIADVKYRSKETSPLRHRVEPGRNVIILNLDRQPVAEKKTKEDVMAAETKDDLSVTKSSQEQPPTELNIAESPPPERADNKLQTDAPEEANP